MMNIELKKEGKEGLNKLYFKGGKFSHVTGSKLNFNLPEPKSNGAAP